MPTGWYNIPGQPGYDPSEPVQRYPRPQQQQPHPAGEPGFVNDPTQSFFGSPVSTPATQAATPTATSGGFGPTTPANYNYRNVDWGLINAYEQRTPQEQAALSSVTDLAKILQGEGTSMYQIGMPAYSQAMGYVRSILGGDKAAASRAIGPLAGMTADIYGGQTRQIEAGPLRGGARDMALAQAAQGQARDIANLLPGMQQSVLGTAVQGGLGGAQLGGALQGQAGAFNEAVVQFEQQNRQFAIGAEQANRFGIGSLDLGNRQVDVQQMLGLGSLALGAQGLQQQASQFAQSFGLAQQQQQFYQWFQQQQLQLQQQKIMAEQQSAQGSMFGSIFGSLLGFAGHVIKPCFITTAICELQGKADDCAEMQTMRRFRDKWLVYQPGGVELAKQYRVIAPKILKRLAETGQTRDVLSEVYTKEMKPAITAIEAEDYELAKSLYISAVKRLMVLTGVEG